MSHPLGQALAVRSDFSVGEGAQSITLMIDQAKELGYRSIALVDTMTVSGMPDLFAAAKKAGIQPIIGATLRVYEDAKYRPPKKGETHELKANREFRLRVYVKSESGLRSLFRLLSLASSPECFYYNPRTDVAMIMATLDPEGVVLTTGDFNSVFHGRPDHRDVVRQLASRFQTWVEIVPIATPLYDTLNHYALATAAALSLPTLASYPALYAKGEADSADILRAITTNTKLGEWKLFVPFTRDFELDEPASLQARMKDMVARGEITPDQARRALLGTIEFCKQDFFVFEKMKPSLPPMAADEFLELVEHVKRGWNERLGAPVMGFKPDDAAIPAYRERLAFELNVLRRMGFSGYFLLVQEIVAWSKGAGIFVGPGRGSVGGSLVAYLMGITDVDPIRFDLLFERFINPDRTDLPDADLDFMTSRRHEVIGHIEAVYGKDKVAGISNYTSLGAASALRDAARVHGLEPFEYACSKQIEKEHGVPMSLEESAEHVPDIAKFRTKHPGVWAHAVKLEGSLRGFGRHAAGVVVAGVPLSERAVVETRSETQVVNWDKRTVEDWGLIKMDILGLSTLDILALARQYIEERHKKRVNYLGLKLDNDQVLREFARGNTVGVFQFESPGMRNLLRELGAKAPLTFDDLVATTALFRPGPLDAGLCEQYVQIKQGVRPVDYEHPSMEVALKPTFGVIIYQEQVMAICRDVAGFTMTEADHVRKAMGKKDKEKMASYREKFIEGAERVAGMSKFQSSLLWDKIEVFAGYAFNKSHSVEYSIISWWAMWLKTFYPAEFYAAALSVVDDDDKVASLVMDARVNDIQVLPPDINCSTQRIEIRGERELIAPFQTLKGCSEKAAQALVTLRGLAGGTFTSREHLDKVVADNSMASKCNKTVRERLAAVGAFCSVEPGSKPPLHPDRLRERLEYLPGITVDAVKADRRLNADTAAVSRVIRLHEDTKTCDACSLKKAPHPAPRMGRTPKFMMVFDAPSWQEEKAGKMLEGDAAAYLKAAMKDAGLSPNDGYYTALVKAAKPRGVKTLTNDQINACSGFLRQEIDTLKPAVIVVMGAAATKFFAPSTKGAPAELVGKTLFDATLDASIVFGINPAQVVFDAGKVTLLQKTCETIAELINP